jgi:hypothetical protein
MKLITKSLGTKRDTCHRTDVRDSASDEIREKVVARGMKPQTEPGNEGVTSAGANAEIIAPP